MPRSPKLARAPKPRTATRWSTAQLYRFATYTPGTPPSASSSPTVGWPRRSSRTPATPTDHGTVASVSDARVTVTRTGRRRRAESRVARARESARALSDGACCAPATPGTRTGTSVASVVASMARRAEERRVMLQDRASVVPRAIAVRG
jgi:hypothetical protein